MARNNEKKRIIVKLLDSLKNRNERKDAFVELTKIAAPETIEELLSAIKKMTWRDSLSVAGYLANFGMKIVPYLKSLIKPTEELKVYTSAIKALGYTNSEQAFNFLFPLLKNQKSWILPKELAFNETINALARCDQGDLNKLMELLYSSNSKVRNGGIYICSKIAIRLNNRKFIDALKEELRLRASDDRGMNVRKMAKLALSWINGDSDISETYQEALEAIYQEDLYPRYKSLMQDIFNRLDYQNMPPRDENGLWTFSIPISPLPFYILLKNDEIFGEGYMIITVRTCKLLTKNILAFYRKLLEYNEFYFSSTAKIFVSDNLILMQDVKKLDSINTEDALTSINNLARRADWLLEEFKEFNIKAEIAWDADIVTVDEDMEPEPI